MWQAVHLGLEEYRAIKCVPKTHLDYEAFRREAFILKELRHPAIPMVYDLEEDADNFYLIEEYVAGDSLYTLITAQGALQEAEAVSYALQICALVEYLHDSCEKSILHLDLQPNNLILCNQTVRLIDFDHASVCDQASLSRRRYGTVGCAAPEQYTSDRLLDQRTDIYAIGAVLRFMVYATLKPEAVRPPQLSEGLVHVIGKCMEPDMEKRYASAGEAADALRRLMVPEPVTKLEKKAISSLCVVLAGSRAGAGTTHLALGLCFYLTRLGCRVLYEEQNQSGALRLLAEVTGSGRSDDCGICLVKGCFMKPWYGPAARLSQPQGFEVVLKDFGTNWQMAQKELLEEKGRFVGVVCENLWEKGRSKALLEQLGTGEGREGTEAILVCRHMSRKRFGRLLASWRAGMGQVRRPLVFMSPEYESPFEQNESLRHFFQAVWSSLSDGSSGKGRQIHGKRSWRGRWQDPD